MKYECDGAVIALQYVVQKSKINTLPASWYTCVPLAALLYGELVHRWYKNECAEICFLDSFSSLQM